MKMAVDEARENVNWSKLSYRISFWQPILDKFNRTVVPVQAAVEFLEVIFIFVSTILILFYFHYNTIFIYLFIESV